MGGVAISVLGQGYSEKIVYDELCKEADKLYRNSSAINSTDGFKVMRSENLIGKIKSDELLPIDKEKVTKYVKDIENKNFIHIINKTDLEIVFCIKLGILEYHLIKPIIKTVSRRKFDTYYLIDEYGAVKDIGSDLDNLKFKLGIKIKEEIKCYKIVANLNNGDEITIIDSEFKTKTTRRRPKELKDCILKEYNLYWFCGWARY